MFSYSLNWMGPISIKWYQDRGLTEQKEVIVREDSVLLKHFQKKGLSPGDVYKYEGISQEYSAGRLDIRDSTKDGYDGWLEYGISPMLSEDWNKFDYWLCGFQTQDLWTLKQIIAEFETAVGKQIRWANV